MENQGASFCSPLSYHRTTNLPNLNLHIFNRQKSLSNLTSNSRVLYSEVPARCNIFSPMKFFYKEYRNSPCWFPIATLSFWNHRPKAQTPAPEKKFLRKLNHRQKESQYQILFVWDGTGGRSCCLLRTITEEHHFSLQLPRCLLQLLICHHEHFCDLKHPYLVNTKYQFGVLC